VWADEKPADADDGVIFPGVQKSTWTYDEQAGAYYFHRFYEYQPDLNITNPAVREEIYKIMGFWLELGISGFRIDAAPSLIELKGIKDTEGVTDPYLYLKEMRNLLSWRRGDAIVLAEANVSMEEVTHYFGDGDKMHMLFHFVVNQGIMLALVREQAAPIVEALKAAPEIPEMGQWAQFIRNHDELSLDKLSDAEREEIAAKFAPDKKNMWIYERGIRRRMPPMLNNDERQIKLAYSLMFTLPGTPVVRYGEEIGMGDDLSLKERNSTRTPMQWSNENNGGFSAAAPEQLVRPVITEGEYGYKQLNVLTQRRNPLSLLNWMERAIRTRNDTPEFGWGKWQLLETGNPSVLAHRCQWKSGIVIAIHNLAREACTVKLDLGQPNVQYFNDLLSDEQYHPVESSSCTVELQGYGYRWLRVGGENF